MRCGSRRALGWLLALGGLAGLVLAAWPRPTRLAAPAAPDPDGASTAPSSTAMIWWSAVVALAVAATMAVLAAQQSGRRSTVAQALTGGEASRAPALMRRYGCAGCHTIPGVPGADGKVAGPLQGYGERVFIAGVIPNTPDHLVRWIVSPEAFSPRTAMPTTGISDADARDVAAFLYGR